MGVQPLAGTHRWCKTDSFILMQLVPLHFSIGWILWSYNLVQFLLILIGSTAALPLLPSGTILFNSIWFPVWFWTYVSYGKFSLDLRVWESPYFWVSHSFTAICSKRKKKKRKNEGEKRRQKGLSGLSILFFKDFIYLFLERGEGRERGRETSACSCFSWDPYWVPGLQPRHCSGWELNWWSFGSEACVQSIEPRQPGLRILKSKFGLKGSHPSFCLVYLMILFYFCLMLSYANC